MIEPNNDSLKYNARAIYLIEMKTTTNVLEEHVDIGITRDNLKKIDDMLNNDLADEYVLLTKTKNYHWNVVDPRFNDLHKFLTGNMSNSQKQ